MRRAARTVCALACLWLAGCAAGGSRSEWLPDAAAPQIELSATPFYPQREYQCGPAALATVLAASGVAVTPDELVPEVYLPARQGSLQVELIAATRKRGLLPYQLPPRDDAPFAQLAAGRPVLVLQKQGAGPWPAWHYAVLVGYDRNSDVVILRSGTDQRQAMSLRRFLWSWERGGRWALVTLEPGSMPAQPELQRYVAAAAGLEAVGQSAAAASAYRAAAAQWPAASLPWLGLANLELARGDAAAAEHLYREALARDPADVAARNNLAEALLALGCRSAAGREIEIARSQPSDGAIAAGVRDTAARIASSNVTDAETCPDAMQARRLVEAGVRPE